MAKIIEFDIDGYISSYGYNNRYVKSFLKEAGKDQVVCHLCSLGGEFLVGVSIKDEFAKHGNVLVDISGYAASAATFIALGAKHTRMSESSFYLIHKILQWVDAWGVMNEDQIAELITDLEKIKDENEKMTLVAAKAYADKSGKPVSEILNLMKEEKWLTADEAKEWGFVDEVYTTTTRFNTSTVAQKLNALGLPELPIAREKQTPGIDMKLLTTEIIAGIKNLIPKKAESRDLQNQNKISMKKFTIINSIFGVESLESADGKGVYLNEAQLQQLENAIVEKDTIIANHHEQDENYNNAINVLNKLHPDIASAKSIEEKVNKIQEKLAKKPGVPASGVHGEGDQHQQDGVDWAKLNAMKHMQE